MFCPNCGNPVSQYMRFCSRCGAQLIAGDAPPEVLPDTAAVPPLSSAPPPQADTPLPKEEPAPSQPEAAAPEPRAEAFSWYAPASARQSTAKRRRGAADATPPGPYSSPAYTPARLAAPEKRHDWIIALVCVLILALIVASAFIVKAAARNTGGAQGQGYRSANDLITAYFNAYESDDADTIVAMLPSSVRDYLHSQNISDSDILGKIDDWSGGYGTEVTFWAISDQHAYSVGDYNFSEYGIRDGDVSQFVDFSCDVTFGSDVSDYGSWADPFGGDYTVDFDLAQISGAWYLIQVW